MAVLFICACHRACSRPEHFLAGSDAGTIPPAQVMQQLGSPEVECVAFATPPIVTKVQSWIAELGGCIAWAAGFTAVRQAMHRLVST